MEVPQVVLLTCDQAARACVEALHRANDLEARGDKREAAIYRTRAMRYADQVQRHLAVMCGLPSKTAAPPPVPRDPSIYRLKGRVSGEATGA